MAATDSSSVLTDVPDQHRYEVRVDGVVAGFAVYHRLGGRIYLVHTEVDPERAAGEPVVPLCPFMRGYIDRHPEYADVVDKEMLASIDGD
jgi:predicted GNAT family acetyltransferase